MAVLAMGCSIAQTQAQSAPPATPYSSCRRLTPPDSTSAASDSARATTPDSSHSIKHKKHSFLDAGLTFQSNDVYLGRKPANTLPYYIPSLSFYHKSGFYISTTLDYVKNSTISRIDLFAVDAGYLFTAHKYDGMVTVSKYFYNSQSTNLTSTIQSSVAWQNSYDLGFVKPSLTVTLNLGGKLDEEARFELGHTFSFFHDNLDLTPTLAAAGSTLNYYDYYQQRIYKIKKKQKVVRTGTADVTTSVVHASTFRIMDYEPAMPIEYTLGKCTISFTPTYTIPVNAATIAAHSVRDNGTVIDNTTTEKIGNSFFFTLGVDFLFR